MIMEKQMHTYQLFIYISLFTSDTLQCVSDLMKSDTAAINRNSYLLDPKFYRNRQGWREEDWIVTLGC